MNANATPFLLTGRGGCRSGSEARHGVFKSSAKPAPKDTFMTSEGIVTVEIQLT